MRRPYVEIWPWLYSFQKQAAAAKDQERLSLCNILHSAFRHREKNPEQALSMCREAAALAERLNEPWMILYYEYWISEMLIFYLGRYEEGLELATRLVAKINQDIYINCPVRGRVFITLIAVYFELYPLSYIDEIRAMIETLERDIPIDEDTHQRLFFYRAWLWLELEDYEKAKTEALKYVEISLTSPFRAAEAYTMLSQVSYLQHSDQQALDYAYLAQEQALRDGRQQALLASSYHWQAALVFLRGETDEAQHLFLLGMAQASMLNLPDEQNALRGTCRYYDVKGEHEASLALWDKQIQKMNPKTPNRATYFYIFLRRCFTLRTLGRLTEADIDQTRQAAQRLHKPEKYLAQIEALHDGKTELPRY